MARRCHAALPYLCSDLPHRQDPAVEQAFFIMPPLNGPGMDNQGVLVVSLGAATATEAAAPEPQQVSASASVSDYARILEAETVGTVRCTWLAQVGVLEERVDRTVSAYPAPSSSPSIHRVPAKTLTLCPSSDPTHPAYQARPVAAVTAPSTLAKRFSRYRRT